MNLNALDPDAFKLLWLWLHQANGVSHTVAELMDLTHASPHLTKKALRALAAEQLVIYNGLADHAVCQLTLNAYNVFMLASQQELEPPQVPEPVQPPVQLVSIPQPPAARPRADQPTDRSAHANQQNSLQKNFFSGEKKFFPGEEEEESLINLNTKDSSSSSKTPKKIFSPDDFSERIKLLHEKAGLENERILHELANLEHCTPEFIQAHVCKFYHVEGRNTGEAGMLRRRLADHWSQPELCPQCRGENNNKYTGGMFAEFIHH